MANEEELGEVRFKRGIFQGDLLSPLLFIVTMIPLTLALRRMTCGYAIGRDREKNNHLFSMDDLKLLIYGKNENEIDFLVQSVVQTVRIFAWSSGLRSVRCLQ